MNGVLWFRLVASCIAFIPVWLMLAVLLPFDPWFHRLKWLIGLDLLLGLILTLVIIWGGVHP